MISCVYVESNKYMICLFFQSTCIFYMNIIKSPQLKTYCTEPAHFNMSCNFSKTFV
jgi:hypothetical protein